MYIDKPLIQTKGKAEVATHDLSKKLILTKDGTFSLLQVRDYTVTVDINGTHNVVSIKRTTLAKIAAEDMPATETERPDNLP